MNDPILIELTRRYCEEHRHYHTLEHIAGMLFAGRGLALSDEQIWAVWFHDAVYDPHSGTNERDSAELAERALSAIGSCRSGIERVRQIVLDTASHVPSIPEAALVIDLDLHGLAASWPVFSRNRDLIRREYAWVPEAEYEAGSRAFFAAFLARPHIYWTAWGRELEPAARGNLQRAMDELPSA